MKKDLEASLSVQEMYQNYFLDYASYVITDRAVPYLEDGLKPVQRRILHSLFELNDGRFHKAANVIGNTMKFHPHGDAAIRDALVNLGQKELLIETQGNWGDPATGDDAAAPRYIECKLSTFALDVAFNKKTTVWQKSYDGRNQEPVVLPMKFPLLLAQGAEGIAVGMATKILPHNFCELIEACIQIVKNKSFKLIPDFLSGGWVDVSEYNDGQSGGKIKVRAKIEVGKKNNLIIREIPHGVTTVSLMESIVNANEKGKIKIKRIEDNTARNVEIQIFLPSGADGKKSIDALYAFTDCEVSISPNCCVIMDRKPKFIGVSELLQLCVKNTVSLLKKELDIKKEELEEKWHFRSLEKIFIENRIYRDIEECETWEAILKAIRKGLKPYLKILKREVTDEDMEKLTEIQIKRISKFDSKKAEEELIALEKELKEVRKNLRNLNDYAIEYFEGLLKKYGKGRERRTQIRRLGEISVSEVILSNLKVGYDSERGFIGTGIKGDGAVADCSLLDELIVFTEEGTMTVTKVAEKTYVGKNIIRVSKFSKDNEHIVYNLAYRDGRIGSTYLKRFSVGGITRDKQYVLTKGKENSKVFHLSEGTADSNKNLFVKLAPKPRIKTEFTVSLAEYAVKGRGSGGNMLTKYPVRRIDFQKGKEIPSENTKMAPGKEKLMGNSSETMGKTVFWDEKNGVVGFGVKGKALGKMGKEDSLLLMYSDGSYITYRATDSIETGSGVEYIGKFDPARVFCAVYVDGNSYSTFAKRFKIVSVTDQKYYYFISDYEDSELKFLTDQRNAEVEMDLVPLRGAANKPVVLALDEGIPLGKVGDLGTRVTTRTAKKVRLTGTKQLSLLE